MRAILETAVEGIITLDDGALIESINPAACRMFGYSPEEILGRSVSVLMLSPDHKNHDAALANYLRTGQARNIGIGLELEGQRKNCTVFPMELSVSEVQLGDARLFTALVRDISERRELEQAVASAREQERTRLARELHDGLGQQIGGLLFLMKGLHRDLLAENSAQSETVGHRPVVGRRREPSNFLATSLRCQERIVFGTNDLGDFIESSSCEPFANLGQANPV